ncbi:MAG TPA: hypothetical protein VFU49_07050, partial [Ktedonobacteraceae bacterium]|nr:hypothetical protein [Ktedonobacteraceae bacterium]
MQQTKRPVPFDDAPLDHLEEGEDGYLPEFPTQPFHVTLPKGRAPIPPRQSRLRVSPAVPAPHSCQRLRSTEDHSTSETEPPRSLTRCVLSWGVSTASPYLLPLGVGMLVMLALIVLWTSAVSGWHQIDLQWHYGDSRITQADYTVGHGGTSHFVALYLDGQAIVIEFPHNGDATQMHLYAHRYYQHDLAHRLVHLSRTSLSDHDVLLVSTDGIAVPFVLY